MIGARPAGRWRAAAALGFAAVASLGPLAVPASPQGPGPSADATSTSTSTTTSTTTTTAPPSTTLPPAAPTQPGAVFGAIQTFDIDAPLGAPVPLLPLAPGTELDLFGMEQAGGTVELTATGGGPVELDGQAHQAVGAIREVAVRDGRLAPAPWSLTATLTDFTVDGAAGGCSGTVGRFACIPASNLGWRPGAIVAWPAEPVAPATELPPVVAGAPVVAMAVGPTFDSSPQLLCASGDLAANAVYVCAANLSLVVPASASAGRYRATLTLTLV